MLGIVNRIFDAVHLKTVEKVKEDGPLKITAYRWAYLNNIVRENYYGRKLNGPRCDKLLDLAEDFTRFLPLELKIYGLALMSFQQFKHSCFTTVLFDNWEQKLEKLKYYYNKLEIGQFPKGHAAFEHIAQWIHIHQKPLGLVSEQSFEVNLKFHD